MSEVLEIVRTGLSYMKWRHQDLMRAGARN